MKTRSSIARHLELMLATILIGISMQWIPAVAQDTVKVSTDSGTYLVLEADIPQIYWTESDFRSSPHSAKIQRLDGRNLQDIISGFALGTYVTLLAVDVEGGKIYYKTQTQNTEKRFYRANLDGSNIQNISSENIQSVAFYGDRIYWTNYVGNQIHTVDQNLSDWQPIDAGPDVGIIAVDAQGAKIYWDVDDTKNPSHLDYRNFKRKIQRANLDGSNIQDLVTGLDLPGSIAVDGHRGKIYWSDRITNKIQRANLDGSNIQDIHTFPVGGLATADSISLDVQRGKIYWVDFLNINQANLDGSNIQSIVNAGLSNVKFSSDSFHVVPSLSPIDIPAPLPEPSEPVKPVPLPEPVEVVSIPDANLAAAVRKALGLKANAPITKRAMQRLTDLDAKESQIKNLTGLEHATRLRRLMLRENQIRDITPLANLKSLKELILESNPVRNIRVLAGMKQLTGLLLGGNAISDFTPLKNLTELEWLSLWGSNIGDVTLLAAMTKLRDLYLGDNNIRNITPLANLTHLKVLELRDNRIRNINPLVGLKKLESLSLRGNPIQDLSPLRTLLKQNPKLKLDIYPDAGPKIEGPWVWMIAPTNAKGPKAARSGKDWLAAASGGSVTEQYIATNGAKAGDAVGNKAWTSGKIPPTGSNNIAEMVNAIGLGSGNYIEYHVAYGSLSLDSPRKQNTKMYVGSDESVKIWLNGVLVHNNPADRGARDYQDTFSVPLKQGRNILLVAVYNGRWHWSGFFGFENDAVYSLAPTSVVHIGATERPPLYWINTSTGTLHRLVGDTVENLAPTVKNVTGIAVDAAGGKLYWTEKTGNTTGKIQRANLAGNPNVQLIKNLTSVPHGIALDATNGKLYVTNAWGKVQRLDVDGSNFQPNLITGLETPRNLVLDVTGGKVYWTEMTEASGHIRRANLNGSNIENVATGLSVEAPLGLAVANNKIYWTEGTGANTGKLQRANLNGRNRELLETLPSAATSIAIDTVRNALYLTLPTGEIQRRDLNGSGEQPVVTGLVSPSTIVLDIPATAPAPPDTTAPPETPVVDAAADVNQDKKVNKTDLLLVVTALGETPPANPNFDVNADGTVNIADVLLVIEALDDPVAAAAPSFGETLTALDPALLSTQIERLRVESDGSLKYEQTIAFLQGLLASIRPTETQLLANYPNPFNPETWIPYQLAQDSEVKISIYDARGSVVRVLVLGHQAAGYYTSRSRAAYWDGRNALGERVASGLYFYQLQTDTPSDLSVLRKMVIRK